MNLYACFSLTDAFSTWSMLLLVWPRDGEQGFACMSLPRIGSRGSESTVAFSPPKGCFDSRLSC